MRHATPSDLLAIETLLAALRARPELRERTPGSFYRKSQAFLHFHEDRGQLFADLKEGAEFVRHALLSPKDEEKLLARIERVLRQSGRKSASPALPG
ncbi:MAG: hypothetical protein ABSF50_07225 [Burkholderiaceae bacterium]|jgi:hypothetical protein